MKNQLRLLITNTEKYSMPIEETAKSIITYITDRMLCKPDLDAITISPFEELPEVKSWLGNIVEVKTTVTTNRESHWGNFNAVHFHHDLEITGFYERLVMTSIVNNCQRIINRLAKEKKHGLGFYKELDKAMDELKIANLANYDSGTHVICKKAKREQIEYNLPLIYQVLKPVTIQLLPKRTVVFDVSETAIRSEDKKVPDKKAITLNLFITDEHLTEAPSITIAKSKQKA